jgi:hypothetical protein
VGCIDEEAQACIDDMRRNTSYNMNSDCNMDNILYEITANDACCPSFGTNGRLQYLGSNYPVAFQCLTDVGCQDSTWYRQLQLECEFICPTSHKEALSLLGQHGTMIDTFPYSSGLTAREALAMGLEVRGHSGVLFCERHTVVFSK